MKFTHLHVHSHYSLLDGLSQIPDLVSAAKGMGMTSLALTDHGVMYGVISGVLALLIMYPLVLWLGPATETFFEFNIFNHFVSDFGRLFGTLVGAGVALGIVSSLLATSRYLRV